MVRGLWLLMLCALATAAGAESLRLELRSDVVEWGKPLRASLIYQGPLQGMDIDYRPWAPWVAVEPDYQQQVVDEQGRPEIRQALRLYPRRSGRFQLPWLKLGDSYSEPAWVTVKAPVVERHAIAIEHDYPAAALWSGQAARVTVTLTTGDERVRVLVDAPETGGVQLIPLQAERRTLADGRVQHRLGWQLLSHRAGAQSVALPMLRYHLHGRDLRRFALPMLPLEVQALPEYIPPTVPVGAPRIHSVIEQDGGRPYWSLTLEADMPLAAGLPAVAIQLAALAGVDAGELRVSHEEQRGLDGYRSRLVYRVPLPDWQWPLQARPSIALRYFDPQTGRLASITHVLPTAWRLPFWFLLPVLLLLTALAAWPLYMALRWLRRVRRRRVLAAEVAAAGSADALRRALLAALAAPNLQAWAGHAGWGVRSVEAGELAAHLNRACFSGEAGPAMDVWRRLQWQAERLARHAPL